MDSIFSIERGTGDSVILLHGFCETHEIWDELANSLAKHYCVIMPDLPGFGKTPLPEHTFSIFDIAQLMLDWIESRQIKNPVIIGHSLGGYVALAMAKINPIIMIGLGLFHSTAQADTAEKQQNRNKVIDFVSKNGAKPFLSSFVPSLFYEKDHPSHKKVEKICATTKPQSIIEYSRAMRDRVDFIQTLNHLKIPTLFIAGDHDSFISPQTIESQAKLSKKPSFHILKNTGHLGMVENPVQSFELVKLFLDRSFSKKN